MTPELQVLTQATIDFLAWFVVPFMVIVVFDWVTGLFKHG